MIVAHHHIWRQADLPWLNGPMQPRIFGSYEAIMRDYLIDEFLADIAGTGIERSVYVQANWAPDRFEDEVAWVQSVANEAGWPHAIVGYANFLADDIRAQLDRLAKYPLMRGVRMQLHWHENDLYRFAAEPELPRNEVLRRNVSLLSEYGWSFDLQVFAGQMEGAAGLAASCPRVTFVSAARRYAGGSQRSGPHGLACGHAASCRQTECCLQTLRSGHISSSQRP